VPSADGSALVEQGQTRVLVAVYGPYEGSRGSGLASGTQQQIDSALRTAKTEYQTALSENSARPEVTRGIAGAVYDDEDEGELSQDDAEDVNESAFGELEQEVRVFGGHEAVSASQRLLPPATARGRIRCEYNVASFAAATASVRSLRAYRRRQRNQQPFATATVPRSIDAEMSQQQLVTPTMQGSFERHHTLRIPTVSINSKYRRKSREAAAQIRDIFEAVVLVGGDINSSGSSRYMPPNAQIDVFVQVLQSDGGDLAVAVNAVSLAMLHAAIPLRDMVVACSATALPVEEVAGSARRFVAVSDPTAWELQQARIWQMAAGAAVPEATVAVLAGKSFQPHPWNFIEKRRPDSLPSTFNEAQIVWLDFQNMAMELPRSESVMHDSIEQFEQVLSLACAAGCSETYRMLREAALAQMHHHILRYEWSGAFLRLSKSQTADALVEWR
jgi:ribonuclease PH